jgi:TfoX/Sxy family transcriptional regulator of competence genes
MASDLRYVDYIHEQAGLAGALTSRKMFGEYALYLDGKVIALVCDNQLFVKPTAEGRALLGAVAERPPYPGARPHFWLDGEIEDRERLGRVFMVTAQALPKPKPKPRPVKPRKDTLAPR